MPRTIIAKDKNNSSVKRIKMDIDKINLPIYQSNDVPFAIRNNIDDLINQLEKIKIEIDKIVNMNKI